MAGCHQIIKWRWVFVLMAHLAWFTNFCQRANLSIAIVRMTNGAFNNSISGKSLTYEFTWSEIEQENFLASFYYGYTISQVVGGYLTDKFGGKWIMTAILLVSSIATLLTPLLVRFRLEAFMSARVLIGVFQGMGFPSLVSMSSRWSALGEQALFTNLIVCGEQSGGLFIAIVGAYLAGSDILGGWPSVFYMSGLVGIVVTIAWLVLVSSKPDQHPWITDSEKLLLSTTSIASNRPRRVPWLKMLTSAPAVVYILCFFCHAWLWITIFTNVSVYFKNVLRLSLLDNGIYTALTLLSCLVMTNLAAPIFDRLQKQNRLSSTKMRKIAFVFLTLSSATLFFAATFLRNSQVALTVTFFCLACGLIETNDNNLVLYCINLTPNFCGILSGIAMTLSCCAMFLHHVTIVQM